MHISALYCYPIQSCGTVPLLLAIEASLQDLNARVEAPLPMHRFRPNIVVAGSTPYAEDHWQALRLGAVDFAVKQASPDAMGWSDHTLLRFWARPLRRLRFMIMRSNSRREGDRLSAIPV